MIRKNNSDTVSKAMQYAGLKEALIALKELESFSRASVTPIISTIENIISSYNCIPCSCLKKRIKNIKKIYSLNEIKYNTKSLISEIEILLKSDEKTDKMII